MSFSWKSGRLLKPHVEQDWQAFHLQKDRLFEESAYVILVLAGQEAVLENPELHFNSLVS